MSFIRCSVVGRIFLAVLLSGVLAACSDRTVGLFSGLSEVEANRLVAFLDGQGIRSRKTIEREGVAVTVASTDLARASYLATQAGLPRTQYKGFGAVFPKDGLISSPLEERARLTYAISQELESMLSDIDGVLGARVNVVVPERRNGRPVDLPSAAVLIRYRSGSETDLLERKVRRLVASSVPGLVEGDDRQISVTLMPVAARRPVSDTSAASTLREVLGVASEVKDRASAVYDVAASVPQKHSSSAVTWLAALLGVMAAVVAIAWALKGYVGQVSRGRREAISPRH